MIFILFKVHAQSFNKAATGSYIFTNNIRHGEIWNKRCLSEHVRKRTKTYEVRKSVDVTIDTSFDISRLKVVIAG